MAKDYALKGPPSISLGTFQSILVQAHSPAAGEAPGMYAAALRYGIDPAVILAIAQHESGFGKAGIAVGRDNLFGSRYYAGTAAFGAINRGGWAAFPSYTASAAYTASLLASSSYAGAGLTARTFPTRYAPASDGNKPAAYGSSIVNAINKWRGEPSTPYVPAAGEGQKAKPKASKHTTAKAPAKGGGIGGGTLVAVGTVALALLLLLLLV